MEKAEPKLRVNTKFTMCKKEEADAACWAFYKPYTPPVLSYYKLLPLKDTEIRIQVEWAGLC
jgi:hypothetical protein